MAWCIVAGGCSTTNSTVTAVAWRTAATVVRADGVEARHARICRAGVDLGGTFVDIGTYLAVSMVALRTASTLEFAREVDAVHTRMARIVQAFVDVNARWIQLVVGRPVAPVANALVSTFCFRSVNIYAVTVGSAELD